MRERERERERESTRERERFPMRCVSANTYVQVRYSEIKNDERKNFKNN